MLAPPSVSEHREPHDPALEAPTHDGEGPMVRVTRVELEVRHQPLGGHLRVQLRIETVDPALIERHPPAANVEYQRRDPVADRVELFEEARRRGIAPCPNDPDRVGEFLVRPNKQSVYDSALARRANSRSDANAKAEAALPHQIDVVHSPDRLDPAETEMVRRRLQQAAGLRSDAGQRPVVGSPEDLLDRGGSRATPARSRRDEIPVAERPDPPRPARRRDARARRQALLGVAHDADVPVQRRELLHEPVLHAVGVLVLVDQQVLPAFLVVAQHLGEAIKQIDREQQQVAEVERVGFGEQALIRRVDLGGGARLDVVRLLGRSSGQISGVLPLVDAPAQALDVWALRVEAAAAHGFAHEPERIVLVVDDEAARAPELADLAAQDAHARRVKCREPDAGALGPEQLRDALAHLARGLVGERHRQDRLGRDPARTN